LKHGEEVLSLACIGGLGLVSGGLNRLRVWAPGADRALCSAPGRAYGLAALPSVGDCARFAAAGGSNRLIEVWEATPAAEAPALRRALQLRGHADFVAPLAALPGAGLLASGCDDSTVRLWDAATGAPAGAAGGHADCVRAAAALPDGRLATGGDDGMVYVCAIGKRSLLELRHPNIVLALAPLGGGRLASGCGDGSVRLWSTADGAAAGVLTGHAGPVCALAELTSGLLASGGADGAIRVWCPDVRACLAVLLVGGGGGRVHALAALPDGRLASGAAGEALVRVWALDSAPGDEGPHHEGALLEVEPAT
jgi:WD40 repeat protein